MLLQKGLLQNVLRTQCASMAVLQDKEILTVDILDTNQGGLISRCQSLQAFIPISHLAKGKDNWLSQEVSCVLVLPCLSGA